MSDDRPIVAGVDGSPSSLAAADYAAGVAERHGAPLHLIHGYLRTRQTYDVTSSLLDTGEPARSEVEQALRDLAKTLRAEHPKLMEIEARQVAGAPVPVLIGQSRSAAVIVVGARGIGGFGELLLGSVSSQLAVYARGPVIVVRPIAGAERMPLAPVLVGYDGSPPSMSALAFAADEANNRGVPLVIANIYSDHVATAAGYGARLVADAASSLLEPYPRLAIELRTVPAVNAAHALLELSRAAALTAVGSRGRGGFAGLLLGSVSRGLVHHAAGPVALIR